jgi:hypothetical protein
MKYSLSTSAFALIGVIAIATAAGAAPAKPNNDGGILGASAAQYRSFANPNKGAFKTNAEVAALVEGGGTAVKSKNVTTVTNPSTGIYCVKPSVKIEQNAIYPQVTVEYGLSSGQSLLAYVDDARHECPSNSIEVLTFDFNEGTIEQSQSVAFYLYID